MSRNDTEFIVQKIRTQYTEKENTKLDELKALDIKVRKPAAVFSIVFGIIGALLRRAKIASCHEITIGNFTINADEHTAILNGEEVRFTAREFNILYKMLSYPKKTFTRTQLMDEFWDVDTESGPRTVDVYMTKLRSKLSECDGFEIQTVHGLGYKAVIK